MKEIRPVRLKKNAFTFCKYTIAGLLWIGLVLQNGGFVFSCFVILLFSIVLKVEKAPLVWLYTMTGEKIKPSQVVIVDESAVRFAHIVGAVFAGIALFLLYFVNPLAGWICTFILAILKTSGAFGLCGAMKLYSCLNNPNGQCCRSGKKIKKHLQKEA